MKISSLIWQILAMSHMSLMIWIRGTGTISTLVDLEARNDPIQLQAGVQNAHVSASADARVCLLLTLSSM